MEKETREYLSETWRREAFANCDFRGWGKKGAFKYAKEHGLDGMAINFADLIAKDKRPRTYAIVYGFNDDEVHDWKDLDKNENWCYTQGEFLEAALEQLKTKQNVWVIVGAKYPTKEQENHTEIIRGKRFDDSKNAWVTS